VLEMIEVSAIAIKISTKKSAGILSERHKFRTGQINNNPHRYRFFRKNLYNNFIILTLITMN
jgi:hypothetical protein